MHCSVVDSTLAIFSIDLKLNSQFIPEISSRVVSDVVVLGDPRVLVQEAVNILNI